VPTYQYVCTECGDQLEAVQKFTDDALTVHEACGGRLRKVFSPVGIVFKGSGFYRTDSRSGAVSSTSGSSAEGSKSDSSSSSGGSEKSSSEKSSAEKSSSEKSSSSKSGDKGEKGASSSSSSAKSAGSSGEKVA
jgi:putative FmdB family regulatory protein